MLCEVIPSASAHPVSPFDLGAILPGAKMKVVAAYLLCLLGGNASPSAKDIEAVLGSGR